MSGVDDPDLLLKRELLMLDVELRRKQIFWETPKGLLLVIAATAAIASAVAGWIGYRVGQTPAQPPIIIQMPAPAAR